MQQSTVEALAAELGGMAGRVERELALRVTAALAELKQKGTELELRFANLEREITARLSSIKDGAPGTSVTVADVLPAIASEIEKQVAALPVPKDGAPGTSVTVADVLPAIASEIEKQVAALPVPKDGAPGTSVTVADVLPAIASEIEKQVAALPVPKDGAPGTSVTVADVLPAIASEIEKQVAALPVPKDGAPGKLPIVRSWTDRVHREGDVVTFDGGTYQAGRDTGKQPPHEDWLCLAAPGANGKDGRSIRIRGTHDAEEKYLELDQVALNGASFTAKKDDPGQCPGEGWQLSSAQGKTGRPGEPGKSIKGDPGKSAAVVRGEVNQDGLLTLENADGSKVEVDFYPVLAKVV
jgi:hypothetical protein